MCLCPVGVLQWWCGNNRLETFVCYVGKFATNLVLSFNIKREPTPIFNVYQQIAHLLLGWNKPQYILKLNLLWREAYIKLPSFKVVCICTHRLIMLYVITFLI